MPSKSEGETARARASRPLFLRSRGNALTRAFARWRSCAHSPISSYNLLHEAVWVDQLSIVQMLLESGAFDGRMEETVKLGNTALHLAAFRATPEVC